MTNFFLLLCILIVKVCLYFLLLLIIILAFGTLQMHIFTMPLSDKAIQVSGSTEFHELETFQNFTSRASLVAQCLRICLPMQGTRVRAPVWEDPTCRGATRPVSHNY